MAIKLWKSRLFSALIARGFNKAFRKEFSKDWFIILGFTVEKDLIFIEQEDDMILVYGSLYSFESSPIVFAGVPFLLDKKDLEQDAKSLYVCVLVSHRIYPRVYSLTPSEETAKEQGTPLVAINSDTLQRKNFYRRVKNLRKQMFGVRIWEKLPEESIRLLIVLPPAISHSVHINSIEYDKLRFLLENEIPVVEWGDEVYRTYPVEWLKEMV